MNDDRQDGCAGIRSHAAILPAPSSGYLDYVYFSALTNTTVGFGDFVPSGPVRFLAGMEALTGLVLITWSASFTFLEMQRYWDRDQAGGRRARGLSGAAGWHADRHRQCADHDLQRHVGRREHHL